MGAIRSIARMDSSSGVVSSLRRSWGLTAVRLSKPEVAAAGGGTRDGPEPRIPPGGCAPGRREWRDRLLNWTAHIAEGPHDHVGRRTGPAHTRAGVLPASSPRGKLANSLTQNARI